MEAPENRYKQILERVFLRVYEKGATEVPFRRGDVQAAAKDLGFEIRNMPDLLYAFNYRGGIPAKLAALAPTGYTWTIAARGRQGKDSGYAFVSRQLADIVPTKNLGYAKIPDATPGIISKHARSDEQALLAKLRYNRLLDVFTGIACYSLQSHLRTQVAGAQLETDEVYIGVDKRGAQYVLPVQAKGGADRQNIMQIERDIQLCKSVWPDLICRPVAAQFVEGGLIAVFLFEEQGGEPKIIAERHYKLVPPDEISQADLERYGKRPD